MPIRRLFNSLALVCLVIGGVRAETLVLLVTDEVSDDPVEGVQVRVAPAGAKGAGAPTVSSFTRRDGTTRLSLASGAWILQLRQGDFAHAEYRIRMPAAADTVRLRLRRIAYHLPERLAMAVAVPTQAGAIALAPAEVDRYPAPAADPLRMVRILPGVASAGDQAPSSYHVRGGSFDENLLYIEGVEIEAPLLLRNGLAQTHSLINGDLVGEMQFHAGVLPAHLGDRLSSALDVGYRRPDSLQIGLRAGTTRQTATMSARQGRLRWIVGARRADLGRLARGLQTRGGVTPDYGDVQALAAWQGDRLDGHLFLVSARSGLLLLPDSRRLRSNCVDPRVAPLPGRSRGAGCEEFVGDASGSEHFEYDIDAVGTRLSTPVFGVRLSARGSVLRRQEREDTDQSFFADWVPSGSQQESVTDWLEQYSVATGDLTQTRWQASLALSSITDESLTVPQEETPTSSWELGAGFQRIDLDVTRSAADSLWLDGRLLPPVIVETDLQREPLNRFGYLQTRWQRGAWWTGWEARALHFGASQEWLVLPRFRLGWQRGAWRGVTAVGLAAQTPHYKEWLAAGDESDQLLAQKGADAFIEIEHQRPRWRLRGTAFTRRGWDRISWTVDDVEVRYAPFNDSRTRAWGTEIMLRGQVGRAVGLISYSWLNSEENLDAADGGADPGWVPTASDQRHTATVYLEDQMDLRVGWMRASRFHIRFLYGSGFPFTALEPVVDAEGQILRLVQGERHARRADPYVRFDVGMTQTFHVAGIDLEVREEVANLFDEFNAVGYRQLPAPDGTMALLPRGLGRRVYNAEVSVRF